MQMTYATINPYTGETVATFPDATDAEVRTALDKADAAFKKWRETSFAERGRVLQNAANILRRDSDAYAKILTLEMGKLLAEAKAEVELSAKIFEYYVRHAETLLKPEKLPVLDPAEGDAVLVHEPLGILLAIEPWNFPYYQIARILSPQLSAGNTLILKHASNVPQSAAAFEKLMNEAGLPEGAFKNLYATRDQINLIINDPRVHGVALTGSEAAGAVVASEAGKALKKSTMELGGADAFVVLADADLEKTIEWAVFGRHWNGGQVCVSSKRMIIVDEIYDRFLDGYRKAVANLIAGDPFDPKTTLAPLSSQKAADDIKEQISKAVSHGAKAEQVGQPVPKQGAFVQPTIITGVDDNNPARYWEFFGPVSMLFRAKDENDAVRIANDSPFGLGGSVFTKNEKHGLEVAKRISTGMVFVNHPTKVEADLPFGGIRRSGYGRELLGLGLKEFVNHKLIDVVDIDAHF
jgi:succinate-semialdehyde dehydrogenase / glutarate-semialdehyde dehydrogenase